MGSIPGRENGTCNSPEVRGRGSDPGTARERGEWETSSDT